MPLPVASSPGFLVNRVLARYMLNAFSLHRERGLSKEALDKAAVNFGMPMGPATLADLTGIDVSPRTIRNDVVATLAGAYGALHGLLNGSTLAAMGAGVASLTGIVLTALLLVLLASAVVAPLQAFWARTVVRVAGSWVVAVGMLMLGWLAQSMA